ESIEDSQDFLRDRFEFGRSHPKDRLDVLRRLLPDPGKIRLRGYVVREPTHSPFEDHPFETLRGHTRFRILRHGAESHANVGDLPGAKTSRSRVRLFDEAVFRWLAKAKGTRGWRFAN